MGVGSSRKANVCKIDILFEVGEKRFFFCLCFVTVFTSNVIIHEFLYSRLGAVLRIRANHLKIIDNETL